MKKALLIMMAALSALAGCKTTGKAGDSAAEPKDTTVMARFVPERMDDFVFENDLIAGRFYGKALEGNPTSPGIDIWVKLPGKLVANEWYAKAMEDGGYYHRDHGGKDCYKVAVSLGGGASAVMLDGRELARGTGRSKKRSEQQAAYEALKQMGIVKDTEGQEV